MTLPERLQAAHQQSVAVYLRRQQIEAERVRWASDAQRCDQELLALDGEIRVLTALVREASVVVTTTSRADRPFETIGYAPAAEAN